MTFEIDWHEKLQKLEKTYRKTFQRRAQLRSGQNDRSVRIENYTQNISKLEKEIAKKKSLEKERLEQQRVEEEKLRKIEEYNRQQKEEIAKMNKNTNSENNSKDDKLKEEDLNSKSEDQKQKERLKAKKENEAEEKRKAQVEEKRKQVKDRENEKPEIQRLQILKEALEPGL